MEQLIRAEALRARTLAGELTEAFSTRKIVASLFPEATVTGRPLPTGVQVVACIADVPLIIYAGSLSAPERRFAIGYAVARLLFDGASSAARVGCATDRGADLRAEAFAGELLVPFERLDPLVLFDPSSTHQAYFDQVAALAGRFNVTMDLINRRIHMLRPIALR